MPTSLSWEDVALRLFLTVAAGALIGFNREEGGHTAGLRTTMLVCLAASVAMIQTNLLLGISGKRPESFAVLDLMRLPLGVLTGMGFIGGGAILRRGDAVQGVTTAATLWLVTVVGLCLGGGQLGLGVTATALALAILWVVKRAEDRLGRCRRSSLDLVIGSTGPTDREVRSLLAEAGFEVASWDVSCRRKGDLVRRTIRCELRWSRQLGGVGAPEAVEALAKRGGVSSWRWRD